MSKDMDMEQACLFPTCPIELRGFDQPLASPLLDIEDRKRSNIFPWRGQFSPQLVENLLRAYCPKDANVLDPFVGSGTVLYEAGCLGLQAQGFELNPAAWILARTYQFMNVNLKDRQDILHSVTRAIKKHFLDAAFLDWNDAPEISRDNFVSTLSEVNQSASYYEVMLIETLVILLDLDNYQLTRGRLYQVLHKLSTLLTSLPYTDVSLRVSLADARSMVLPDNVVDFVITSPPYINVFNYHQNYRRSVEALGWDVLKIARSEIGSNRANRSNRFLTVIQYCIDMSLVLREIHRVCKTSSRVILIVGHESNVLGVPFFNADILERAARSMHGYALHQRQQRVFKNKFGKNIREDILHISCSGACTTAEETRAIGRRIAARELQRGLAVVSTENRQYLLDALDRVDTVQDTPVHHNESYLHLGGNV